jgi:Ca2+-transporting ATPase
MARHNAIIRKLIAVETLGSTTVICSDKTGTLTYNQMTVRKIFADDSWFEISGEGYEPRGEFTQNDQPISLKDRPSIDRLLRAGCLCSDAALRQSEGQFEIIGDPTEGALVVAAAKAGLQKKELEQTNSRLDEMPFQSERQFMATLHQESENRILYVKGAPEKLFGLSGSYLLDGKTLPMTEGQREKFRKAAEGMAQDAMRVLALAYRIFPAGKNKIHAADLEGQLVLIGLTGMMDPPRDEVRKAIALCQKGGIKVVMATGDNPLTGQAIAHALGIREGLNLTGRDLNQMSDSELEEKIEKVSVLARIEPLHKMRIVKAFKKRGQIVAMTGDGVNDAPALEAADIGVAMGITGTDVAKEASDMVLADDNFNSIVTAVEEGRAIFNRLRNVSIFLMTTCFGELLTLILGVLFLGQAPLVPMQILWINLVTGALITIPLGLEPCVGDELSYPPRHPKVGLLFPGLLFRIFFLAGLLGISSFSVFLWTLQHYELHEARTLTFCAIVIFEWLVAFNARSDEATIFKLGFFKNRLLIKAILLGAVLQAAVIYLPFMHHAMDTVALKWFEWLIALVPGLLIFVLETLRKLLAPRLFSWGKWQPIRLRSKKAFGALKNAA